MVEVQQIYKDIRQSPAAFAVTRLSRMTRFPSPSLFLLTPLRPKRTGLRFVVYVGPRGDAHYGPCIRASNQYGDKVSEGDWFSITVEEEPRVKGEAIGLESWDVELGRKWIQVNKIELLKICNDEVDVFDATLQQVRAREIVVTEHKGK